MFWVIRRKEVTVCPRSSDPFYIVTYYKKWVTNSWTHSIKKVCIFLKSK